MLESRKRVEFKRRFLLAERTEKWAVTMTKVRIRQVVRRKRWPRWHFISFLGRAGGESTGVVDIIAVRKDHGTPRPGTKRGDALQIVLIQVKGGYASRPTAEDAERLRVVARHHRARAALLATWKKGSAARFYKLSPRPNNDWIEISDLAAIFC